MTKSCFAGDHHPIIPSSHHPISQISQTCQICQICQAGDQAARQHCRRLAVLLTRPPLGEDGVSFCVVPPDALTPPLQNVVQVLGDRELCGCYPYRTKKTHESKIRDWETLRL